MDPSIFKIVHFLGLIVLFTGIGSLIAADPKKPAAMRGPAMVHGIGWLLVLLSGFGMAGILKLGFPMWMIGKLLILLVLGAIIVVIKRRLLPTPAIYLLVIALGIAAAYLGFANSVILR